ncbi:SsgA family sporulation/cell division regulator [Streptomyces sp. NBC_01304]|uniref:SsgA family sporulation/cell division regulator n=1 Tax=Streptomyces sp. NBC_01304 TaxID=2903818 RepID=UPI002E127B54|nr:SsgA family sporulation/cell division regulator [Streptomyces sp. NBC_01304]
MSVVEEWARGHIVADDGPGGHHAVRVALRYDPEPTPGTVMISFPGSPGGQEWKFSRELLEQGMRAPAESGDVRIWPCGRVQTVIEFHAEHEVAVVQFDSVPLTRFLRRTYTTATSIPQ